MLWFLAKHEFIKITCNITSEETLTLRVYLVPVDLSGVKGRLHHRNRNDRILGPARQYLRKILPQISRSKGKWYGYSGEDASDRETLLDIFQDSRTLSGIYGDIASPKVDLSNPCCETVARLLDFDDELNGLGFRSVLYRYQRESIASMVSREIDPRAVQDPLGLPLSTINGKDFDLLPATMEVRNGRGYVDPTRGGLLCEELGTGKTVMILGLILSTLKQLPSPPDTIDEPLVILTPLAVKSFPSGAYASARQTIYRGQIDRDNSSSRIPSLTELVCHIARTDPLWVLPNPHTPRGRRLYNKHLELENQFEMTQVNELLQQNTPFYLHPFEEKSDDWNFRKSDSKRPRIMYLSPATLVVVPPNLLSQWYREISKHCELALRVLVLRSGTKMPSAVALASEYDIILMTYNRYTAEAAHKKISALHSLPPCECPNIPGSRIPDCKCPSPANASPLLQVRWKRLVIDEGHVSASLSTNLTPFTKLLSVERRWIVTGTPTTNLLGLSLGKNTISEVVPTTGKEPDSNEEDYVTSETDENTPSQQSSPSSPSHLSQEIRQRIWNKYDRADLAKLDNMITHFIAVPQFIAFPKLLSQHIREPLLDKNGPRPGSIQVLTQLMEMIMIRHRIEDVEKDVALPPVVHESILLDLDPIVMKSYNAMQATIAINAIDSQRTDQDYLFHSRNAEFLQLTVKNMSQLMFWSVDETLYNADQLMQTAQATTDLAISRNMPPEDIQLLQEAFRHVRLAATDPVWRSIQNHEDVPYRVYDIPHKIFNSWTRTPGFKEINDPSLRGLLHADRLLSLQSLIFSRPLITETLILEQGSEVAKTDIEHRQAFEESFKRNKNKHSRKYSHSTVKPGAVENAAKKAMAPNTLKEMRKELDQSLAKLEKEEGEGEGEIASVNTESNAVSGSAPSVLLRSSVLAGVAVGSSASSKLNYIINEVMIHSTEEKILIFSDSELTLAHVAEALELIQIKFLRFTTQIQPQFREQLVLTFETSETYRVFLMELKHGARGLNLISASRVIFCEPVWQADVESQAIKRVHRIGQTRSITVKTLAIRGTAEETMVERRNLFKGSNDKVPKLLEESGMRHFIANPKFLVDKPDRLPHVAFRLIPSPRKPSFPSSEVVKITVPTPHPPLTPLHDYTESTSTNQLLEGYDTLMKDDTEYPSPTKKQRIVHFG
ncbi:hypothetical protein AGABI1DRAFT_67996 [Agaricus bisporus var. burnettii JB137-S8]|uniref:Helicase ATP-binding domain-containing protein n=1 Tax=Agaricus bisporus var. burnettii (strain JB137-S8 / ATCC MYA-4627 / FGSC 10392) TaxID=597362 RepID=K5Y382_AGABU|nr:uncharacterized protein AGABI1DRAFT_67996 [Agaricus bisporus var. burnettii JB137-S8]EKM82385.1 hypothetical protein AGABI1DRAFT_67996 [Agaricus bisporus var. burnettii JB137-S8]